METKQEIKARIIEELLYFAELMDDGKKELHLVSVDEDDIENYFTPCLTGPTKEQIRFALLPINDCNGCGTLELVNFTLAGYSYCPNCGGKLTKP